MNMPWLTHHDQRLKSQALNPPQAICLVGVEGLGQFTLAERFAQAVLATDNLSLHPDYLVIAPEEGKSIGINIVREIHDFCLIPTTRAKHKVVLIPSVDTMTLPAQQAFLKTLEEPVIPTCFILVSSQPQRLLPTLRSRCQVTHLPSIPYAQAKAWLQEQQLNITEEAYALTDGGPLLALNESFQHRQLAYDSLKQQLGRRSISADNIKQMNKSEPNDILTGFYYALMHEKKFELLDHCIALRKQYSENSNLNWEMQLTGFLLETQQHAR